MTVLRGILAVLAGSAAAALAGIGVNFGNQMFHWVEPAYGYMYFYPWLMLVGGVLGAGLGGALFALWNRGPAQAPHPARAVLAGAAGVGWALIAGVVFDYANGYYCWLNGETAFPYGYACLTFAGGVLGALAAVVCYRNWHLARAGAGSGSPASTATQTVSRHKAQAGGGADYTSARQQASGFAEVPGMPLGDFQGALDPGKDAKAKE